MGRPHGLFQANVVPGRPASRARRWVAMAVVALAMILASACILNLTRRSVVVVEPSLAPDKRIVDLACVEEIQRKIPQKSDAACDDPAMPLPAAFRCRTSVAREETLKYCARLSLRPTRLDFFTSSFKLHIFKSAGHEPPRDDVTMYLVDGEPVSTRIRNAGAWEVDEIHSILNVLKELKDASDGSQGPPAFIDVGAGVGVVSIAVAAMGYRVYAFESQAPAHALYRTLCANPWLQKNLILFPQVLGDQSAVCHMVGSLTSTSKVNLVCGDDLWTALNGNCELHKNAVWVSRFANVIAGTPAAVLRLNGRGRELLVMNGTDEFLTDSRLEYILLRPSASKDSHALVERLQNLGYSARLSSFQAQQVDAESTQTMINHLRTSITSLDAQSYLPSIYFTGPRSRENAADASSGARAAAAAAAAAGREAARGSCSGALSVGDASAVGARRTGSGFDGRQGMVASDLAVAGLVEQRWSGIEETPYYVSYTGRRCRPQEFQMPFKADQVCDQNSWAGSARDLFECRKAAARKLSLRECEVSPAGLQGPRSDAQLTVANISLEEFTVAGRTPRMTSVQLVVQTHSDEASNAVKESGVWNRPFVQSVLDALASSQLPGSLRPGALLDVGAGVGAVAFVAATFGFDVIAFEHSPMKVRAMQRTLCLQPWLRPRITIIPFTPTASAHLCQLWKDAEAAGGLRVACSATDSDAAVHECLDGAGMVWGVSLESYLAGVNIGVLKMNGQGLEHTVIRSAGLEFLRSLSYVFLDALPKDVPQPDDPVAAPQSSHLSKLLDAGFVVHADSQRAAAAAEAAATTGGDEGASPASVTVMLERAAAASVDVECMDLDTVQQAAKVDAACDSPELAEGGPDEKLNCRMEAAKAATRMKCRELLMHPTKTPMRASLVRLSDLLVPGAPPVPPMTMLTPVMPETVTSLLDAGTATGKSARAVLAALSAVKKRVSLRAPLFYDVGAGFGLLTFAAAAMGNEVLAFESSPVNQEAIYSTLCRNPWLQQRITFFPIALGAQQDKCHLWGNATWPHLRCRDDANRDLADQCHQHSGVARVEPLSDYVGSRGADVMKVDLGRSDQRVFSPKGDPVLRSVQYFLANVNISQSSLPPDARAPDESVAQMELHTLRQYNFSFHLDSFSALELPPGQACARVLKNDTGGDLFLVKQIDGMDVGLPKSSVRGWPTVSNDGGAAQVVDVVQ